MANNEKLKFGVVGTGYLGQHHARIYHALDQCELVGICETNDKVAEKICKKYNCQRFHSLEELGAACDGVSVVVPTDKHCEVSLPLLEAGAHLLVEKPISTSLDEATKIVTLAKEKNLIVQIGHIEHYNPVMTFLEEVVNFPRFITVDRLAPFNIRGTEVGVVLDLMIHDIGIILQLVKSPIERIDSVGINVQSDKEDIANARITFENGAVANLNTSRVSLKKERKIRIFQPHAYLSLDFMEQKGHIVRRGKLGLKKKKIPIEKGEPLMIELTAFANCIARSHEPKVSAAFGTTALDVAIQITEQIASGIKKAEDYFAHESPDIISSF